MRRDINGKFMRRHLPDIALAVELYYTKVELTTDDIHALFGVSASGATALRKQALELMAEEKVRCWLPHAVNTSVAYRAWQIDIEDYEKRLAKLRKLGLKKEDSA